MSLFQDVRAFLITETIEPTRREEIHNLLTSNGARINGFLTDAINLIVADHPNSAEVLTARDIYNIKNIVSSHWVINCVQNGVLFPCKAFSSDNKIIFDGLIVTISNIPPQLAHRLWVSLVTAGATCQRTLTNRTTHLIVLYPTGIKFNRAISRGVKVVGPHWVLDSVRFGNLLDEALYQSLMPRPALPVTSAGDAQAIQDLAASLKMEAQQIVQQQIRHVPPSVPPHPATLHLQHPNSPLEPLDPSKIREMVEQQQLSQPQPQPQLTQANPIGQQNQYRLPNPQTSQHQMWSPQSHMGLENPNLYQPQGIRHVNSSLIQQPAAGQRMSGAHLAGMSTTTQGSPQQQPQTPLSFVQSPRFGQPPSVQSAPGRSPLGSPTALPPQSPYGRPTSGTGTPGSQASPAVPLQAPIYAGTSPVLPPSNQQFHQQMVYTRPPSSQQYPQYAQYNQGWAPQMSPHYVGPGGPRQQIPQGQNPRMMVPPQQRMPAYPSGFQQGFNQRPPFHPAQSPPQQYPQYVYPAQQQYYTANSGQQFQQPLQSPRFRPQQHQMIAGPTGGMRQYGPQQPMLSPTLQQPPQSPYLPPQVPPELCMVSCVFVIIDYDRILDQQEMKNWKIVVTMYGGQIETRYSERVTHVLCESIRHPVVAQALKEQKRVVTAQWLNDCLQQKRMQPPWKAVHLPSFFGEAKPAKGKIFAASGFDEHERQCLKQMVAGVGGQFTPYLWKMNSFLIAKRLESPKSEKAKEWNIPIVNVRWLTELFVGFPAINSFNEPQFKIFDPNVGDPFRLDPSVFEKLSTSYQMLISSWRIPIPLTTEAFQYAAEQKEKLDNDQELMSPAPEEEEIAVKRRELTNSNIRPVHVCFSGLYPAELENLSKKSRWLGAEVVSDVRAASHLISKGLKRTKKVLEAVALGKLIVKPDWIKESYRQQKFLDSIDFIMKDINIEQLYGFNLKLSLYCARQKRLFENMLFYLTPSVLPSRQILADLIRAAGGQALEERPSCAKVAEFFEKHIPFVIICCENDLHLCQSLLECGVVVHSAEFVMTGILRQEVDYMAYRLETKSNNNNNSD